MRGVVSGAMLIALKDMGVTDVVDTFYGTSSGGINLAYYAAGASWEGLAIYADHLTTGFVRPVQHRLTKPMLNMNYVFKEVLVDRVPLDKEEIKTGKLDARIVLTNVDSKQPEILRLADVTDRLHEYLEAGSWLPVLAGAPYRIDNGRYLDGGMLWPDPSYAARAEGYTHILVLNTAAGDERVVSSRSRFLLRHTMNVWRSGLGDEYVRSRELWSREKTSAPLGEAGHLGHAAVLRLAPPLGSHHVERLTMDKYALLEGARAGYTTITRELGDDNRKAYFSLSLL